MGSSPKISTASSQPGTTALRHSLVTLRKKQLENQSQYSLLPSGLTMNPEFLRGFDRVRLRHITKRLASAKTARWWISGQLPLPFSTNTVGLSALRESPVTLPNVSARGKNWKFSCAVNKTPAKKLRLPIT